MMQPASRQIILAAIVLWLSVADISNAYSQALPGPADAGRITLPRETISSPAGPRLTIPESEAHTAAPVAAKTIAFTLKKVNLEGVTAFTPEQLADIYAPYLGKETTLDTVWQIAGLITERYRAHQYFLSRAYVPAQEIDGTVTIKVVEGYIGKIVLDDRISKRHIVERLREELLSKKPVKAYEVESCLLRLNDLPGMSFRAVIEPLENAPEGAAKLTLLATSEGGHASVTLDNLGSRFLGPYQSMLAWQGSIIPLQQSTVSLSTSLPADELKYASLDHRVPLYPGWELAFSGNYVTASPGFRLEPLDIASQSVELSAGIRYQPIRQWQENLIFSLALEGKNTDNDILGDNPLTRDRIRSAHAALSYDTADHWNGHNYLNFGIRRGLGVFGASDAGDANLSRAEAEPDFTKAELAYMREQPVGASFLLIGQLAGQWASGPLFSSEEFGYGGQGFGRAYDASEITGDHGLAGSLELRYLGLTPWQDITPSPYVFYDIGKVWNEDLGGADVSAASAGLGLRLTHPIGLSANAGLAWPLTRAIDAPLYGNGKNPRILMQIGYAF